MLADLSQKQEALHHRKSVTVLVLAVIVFGALVCAYLYNGASVGDYVTSSSVPTIQSQMVAELRQAPDASLTNVQKSAVVKYLSKSGTTLTTAQKLDTIKTLQGR